MGSGAQFQLEYQGVGEKLMPIQTLFWVIYLFALLIGGWGYYGQEAWPRRAGGHFVLWLLVGIIGWKVFGSAVK